jgi:hypothetical protein
LTSRRDRCRASFDLVSTAECVTGFEDAPDLVDGYDQFAVVALAGEAHHQSPALLEIGLVRGEDWGGE